MLKITVMLFGSKDNAGKPGFFHLTTGLLAIVQDLDDASKAFWVNPFFGRERHKIEIPEFTNARRVVLYSDKKYAKFVESYINKFGENNKNVNFGFINNCSKLVNFTLDTLFPESEKLNKVMTAWQTLFCSCGLLTCGSRCLPAPPCFDTPTDVFRKAEHLARKHGKPCEAEIELSTVRFHN